VDDELAEIRHQLEILCRKKRARTSAWTPDRPTDWRPNSVINPEDCQPFTDCGAWEFVADCLSRGILLEPIELDLPTGKTGYVMTIPLGDRDLYVKLQLGAGKVIGRSFHYSNRRSDEANDGAKSRREGDERIEK
jgi:hypothetical protein